MESSRRHNPWDQTSDTPNGIKPATRLVGSSQRYTWGIKPATRLMRSTSDTPNEIESTTQPMGSN
ncbi:hypothetical protein BDV37DRAFT_267131 [Aspergillus pseudonomiae]|uniref:Uncharacterized protein n=1 Tax=Aspergillus pseudonomiae TaxID=1506151 RepID=A0A5N7CSJ7_9EURO|nr:uncharacterized protein BDV37DRAFT_267131 [Aspergillus pseudonomiae]KAE8396909.1 hypothetical protein BDV37DRAFT_267131 [Aspergillus pseudonomiae]